MTIGDATLNELKYFNIPIEQRKFVHKNCMNKSQIQIVIQNYSNPAMTVQLVNRNRGGVEKQLNHLATQTNLRKTCKCNARPPDIK